MEFVGKAVKKEVENGGLLSGSVRSYDPGSESVVIEYENGSSESLGLLDLGSVLETENAELKPKPKRGRRPKKRRGNRNAVSDNKVNEFDLNLDKNGGFDDTIETNDGNFDAGKNGETLGLGSGGIGVDLNEGIGFEEGCETGIDLNVDVRVEYDESFKMREREFDLNLGVGDEEMKDVELVEEGKENGDGHCGCGVEDGMLVDVNVDVVETGFGGGNLVSDEKENCAVDTASDKDCRTPEVPVKGSLSEDGGVVRDQRESEIGSSYRQGTGRSKRRKVAGVVKQGETVLRRSTRKMSAQNHAVGTNSCVGNDVSSSPSVSALSEDKQNPLASADEEPEDSDVVPPKLELPLSSGNLDIDEVPLLDVFSVYAFLRSFSTVLFLSPFDLEDFVAAVKCKSPSVLFDSVHVSILRALMKHLERLSDEGSESASDCLRNLNWGLLDLNTWPVFLVEYILIYGTEPRLSVNISQLKLFRNDYCMQSASVKVEILRCLCDNMIEVEAFRSELNRRSVSAEPDIDFDRAVNSEHRKKRRTTMNAYASSLLDEEAVDVNDWNSDECCLCKMDGNLICCDGCPAAYHSKCVGVANHLLPEGDWFCPECEIERRQPWMKPRKSLRGAELLGVDPHGRLYFGSCGYLLVLNSCDEESAVNYYHRNDLNIVIEVLKSSYKYYSGLIMSILKHWNVSAGSNGDVLSSKMSGVRNVAKEGTGIEGNYSSQTGTLSSSNLTCEAPKSLYLLNPGTKIMSPYMSSEGSAEIIQANSGIQNGQMAAEGDSNGSAEPVSQHEEPGKSPPACTRKSSKRKGRKSDGPHKRSVPDLGRDNASLVYTGIDYENRYSFAQTASSVAEELMCKASGKVNANRMNTEVEIISMQTKAILRNLTKFYGPNNQNANVNLQKEKCGWCFNCRNITDERDCLFSTISQKEYSSETANIQLKRINKGHLIDVLCHIISTEDRLHGLLSGPWLNAHYSKMLHKSVIEASSVSSVKRVLLMLEANLDSRALSSEWFKYVDSEIAVGSASHIVISSLRASTKQGIGRKGARVSFEYTTNRNTGSGLGIYWWRGGQLSRQLFSWKNLPRRLASKAAKQAGCTKIPGILYNEGSEYAKRTKSMAWRAAVEMSTSAEQLALQVRELNSNIRWDDIENTHILCNLDKETRKSIRLFKKAIVRRKCKEGNIVKYLLDFGKRRGIPDVVRQNGTPVEEPSNERKKYWLGESFVPLHLLKNFEDKRIARTSSKVEPGQLSEFGCQMKRSSRKRGFSYLFSRAEKIQYYQCGHCHKDVLIEEAVSCQSCGGFFHKRHVRKSGGVIAAECIYTCHRCQDGIYINIDAKRQRIDANRKKNFKKSDKVQSKNCQKTSKGSKRVQSRNSRKVAGARQTQSEGTKNIPATIVLRRSARRVKLASMQHNKIAEAKKGKKKGKKRKAKKKITMKLKKGTSWQKKRTPVYHSYWLNGLLFSRRPDDDRVAVFRGKSVLIPTEQLSTIVDPPSCHICSEAGYKYILIGCDNCGDWFHGDAFGLDGSNISKLIGFRCHNCRKRSPPICPHAQAMEVDDLNLVEGQNDIDDDDVFSLCNVSLKHEPKPTAKNDAVSSQKPSIPSLTPNQVLALESELEEDVTLPACKKLKKDVIEEFDDLLKPNVVNGSDKDDI